MIYNYTACHLNLSHAMIGFPCLRDGKCIPANLTCDGTGHCGYWEDEDLITCKGIHASSTCDSFHSTWLRARTKLKESVFLI